jgi:hypothetical protein
MLRFWRKRERTAEVVRLLVALESASAARR